MSEKVKEIKKALETCMHTRVSSCRECPYNYTNTKTKHSECFRMAEHALTLINELENENEILKINMHETENLSFQINQMNRDLILENQTLKDRISELEDKIENGTLVEIDKSLIGQGIIGIHHYTDGTYQLDWDENIVIGFSSDGVITWNETHLYNDEFRNDMFFIDNEKGRAEAEAKLKELQEEKK